VTEPIDGLDAMWLAVANTRVVDDGVIPAKVVDLLGEPPRLGDAGQIAHHDGLGLRERALGVGRSGGIARVQGYRVAVLDEQSCRHQPEPVGGPGDQDAMHRRLLHDRCEVGTLPPSTVMTNPIVNGYITHYR
jgi:hypothetical protein